MYDAEDTSVLIFRYIKKNIIGSLLVSRVIPPKQEYLNVFGTRGVIHLERGKIERFSPCGDIQESLTRNDRWPSAAQDQIEYFVRVIRGEKENLGDPAYHLQHLAFIEAAYRANDERRYFNPFKLLPR